MLVPQSYKISVVLGRTLFQHSSVRTLSTTQSALRALELREKSWWNREGAATPGSRRLRRMLPFDETDPCQSGSAEARQLERSSKQRIRDHEPRREPRGLGKTNDRASFGLRSTAGPSFGRREARIDRHEERSEDPEWSDWKTQRQRWAMPDDEPPPLRFHDPSSPPSRIRPPPSDPIPKQVSSVSPPPAPRPHPETVDDLPTEPRRPWEPTKKLTYAGMASLKALHLLDPARFTRGHLSETFGISEEAVRRICRSTFRDKAVNALLADHRIGGQGLTDAAYEHGGLNVEQDAGSTTNTSHFGLRGAAGRRDERDPNTLVGTKWDRDPGSSATYSAAGALVRAYRQVKKQ